MDEGYGGWLRDLGVPGGMSALIYVLYRVLLWLKPMAADVIKAHLSLTKKLETNLDQQIINDQTTHTKLDTLQKDVTVIRDHVVTKPEA